MARGGSLRQLWPVARLASLMERDARAIIIDVGMTTMMVMIDIKVLEGWVFDSALVRGGRCFTC